MNIIKKIFQNKTLINGGLFSIYSFFQRGVGFVLLIILATYIAPNDYGHLSLFNTAVMFLTYFSGFNTAGYISVSYFSSKEIKEFRQDFTSIFLLLIGSLFILSCVLIPFGESLSQILSITPFQIIIALLIATCSTSSDILLNYLRIQEKVISYGIYACTSSVLSAILTLILVIKMNQGWYGYVESNFIIKMLFAIISIFLFYKWGLFHIKGITLERVKKIAYWGIPLIPHLATIWIRQGMDRYIIQYNHTTTEVGIFSFALNLVSIIIMIGSSFNNSFSVNIYKTLSLDISIEERISLLKRQGKKIMLVYIVATIVIFLGVLLFVPILMPRYSSAIKYFAILAIYGFLQCLYFLYCNYFFYYKQTKKLMYITFSSSVLHLLLSLFLTPFSLLYTCIIYVLIQLIILYFTKTIGLKLIINNTQKNYTYSK